jgi:hypothetical protein
MSGEWNEYRDKVRAIRQEATAALEKLFEEARESGRFPLDHTNDLGDQDRSAVVRAERIASQIDKTFSELADRLTLPMTREEAANFQDHS